MPHADPPLALPVRSVSGIEHPELELAGAEAELHAGSHRAGVLEDVRERLLDDPVADEIHSRRKWLRPTLDVQLDLEAARASTVEQRTELREDRCGRPREHVAATANDADESPQLDERLASAALDNRKRSVCRGEIVAGDAACATGLHDDHADAVGDHIVQLTRHPRALFDRSPSSATLVVALQPLPARLELAGQQ